MIRTHNNEVFLLRAIIVDDEQPSIDMLLLLLAGEEAIEVVGTYRKPREALLEAAEVQPDVAFLDVDMPAMNGLELAGHLAEICGGLEIVFTTAHEQYALEAFKHSAIDYLLKPLTREAVHGTAKRLQRRLGAAASPAAQTEAGAYAKCFGEFSVTGRSGQRIKWRTSKTEELMAYFLVKSGAPISKWEIFADLWPETSGEQAHTYLHTTLYNLKKALKEAGIEADIAHTMGKYNVKFLGLRNELSEFARFVERNPQVTADNEKTYIRMTALYSAELFGDCDYAWNAAQREKLHQVYGRAVRRLGRYLLETGQSEAAADALRRLLAISPFDETAHEAMLRVFAARWDRVGLVRHFEGMRALFENELGLPVNPSLVRVYHQLLGEIIGRESKA